MGEACSKPDKDTKNEIDKNSMFLNQNPNLQPEPYDSDARFYEDPGYNYSKERQNRIYESRYIDQPGIKVNKANVIPDETINSYHNFDINATNMDRSNVNRSRNNLNDDPYDLRRNPSPMNLSNNQSVNNKKVNFYEDGSEDAIIQNDKRSMSNLRFDDYDVSDNKRKRIFDDGQQRQKTKSPNKNENDQRDQHIGNQQISKSSNIFNLDPNGNTFKGDTNVQASELQNKTFDKDTDVTTKNIDKNTFKEFLNHTDDNNNNAKLQKLSKHRSPTPKKRDDSMKERSDNKSNVKVALKNDFNNNVYLGQHNSGYYNNRTDSKGKDYESYGYNHNPVHYDAQRQPIHFNHNPFERILNDPINDPRQSIPLKDYQDQINNRQSQQLDNTLQRTSPINPNKQPNSKMSQFMRMSAYRESYAFNIIGESNFDKLPSVNDNRGIRESTFHALPDFQPQKSDFKGMPKNLSPIKEESQVDNNDKFVPIRLKDGNTYIGSLKSNLPDGKGKEIFMNGDIYTGEFVEGKRHGDGTYEKKDDFIYIGGFKNNKFEGKGKKLFINGNTFEGFFKNGREEGTGALRNFEEKIIQRGMWIDGEFTKL